MASSASTASPPDDLGRSTNIATWTLTAISIVATVLRLVARNMKKDFGVDDIIIVLSICFLITFNVLISVSISYGLGAHVQTIDKAQAPVVTKWTVITNTLAVHCFTWPKLAVVLLLRRLLLPGRTAQIVLFTTIGLLGGCVVVLDYLLVGVCNPPAKQWDKTLPGTCMNPSILTNFAIFSGSLSASLDLGYAVYPVYKIWKLQMSVRRRVGYCSIMSLGFVAFAFTVYKCTKLPALNDPPDPTYLGAQLILWTSIESNVVTLAACIPTLSPLIRLLKDQTLKSLGKYGSSERPSKYPTISTFKGPRSHRSQHIRLTEDDYPGASLGGTTYGTGNHTRQSSTVNPGVNGRREDLESGPPSSDDIELLDNPYNGQNQTWAGKPVSQRGSAQDIVDEPRGSAWPVGGIARNVEVSVTESRRQTPDRRL